MWKQTIGWINHSFEGAPEEGCSKSSWANNSCVIRNCLQNCQLHTIVLFFNICEPLDSISCVAKGSSLWSQGHLRATYGIWDSTETASLQIFLPKSGWLLARTWPRRRLIRLDLKNSGVIVTLSRLSHFQLWFFGWSIASFANLGCVAPWWDDVWGPNSPPKPKLSETFKWSRKLVPGCGGKAHLCAQCCLQGGLSHAQRRNWDMRKGASEKCATAQVT